MSTSAIRYPNRHRPEPVREAVVLRYKNSVSCSARQWKIGGIHFEMSRPSHVIVRQIGLIIMPNDSAITQIPIDRRLL